MYVIKIDGQVLYSPAMTGEAYQVFNPKLSLDINSAGSLSFVMPPGNRMHGSIHKLKSVVTVEQDGQEIFRGRVVDDVKDTHNQRSVYCEGMRAYLLDSQCAPYTYSGTAGGLLKKLIEAHNAQVEEEKQFALGEVSPALAGEAIEEVTNVAYWETFREIEEKLLNAYGGYLRTRMDAGKQVIDWVKEPGGTNTQGIHFSINLLDISDKIDAADVFTVLIPLGESQIGDDGEYGEALTIASVNGGLNYIQDDEAVKLYGKIWRTHTWAYEDDPNKLLKKGRAYLKTGAALHTLTLTAIDMHVMDGSVQAIRIGDKVRILSRPHGIDLEKVCTKMEIDLINPENSIYTFGEAPKTLTENIVLDEEEIDGMTGGGGGRGSIKEQIGHIIRWANVKIDEANANILLSAGEIDNLEGRMNKAEIEIDGLNAQILLKASQEVVDDMHARLSQAEIEIDGANAQILLKASQQSVDDLGSRVSAAEIEIDGLNSEITLKADRVTIDAELTTINKYFAGSATAAKMVVTDLTALKFTFDGNAVKWSSMEVVTGVSGASTGEIVVRDGDGNIAGTALTGYRVSVDKAQIYYLTW